METADLGKNNISWRDCIILIILAIVAYTLHFQAKQTDKFTRIEESLTRIEILLNEPVDVDFTIKPNN